MSMWKKWGKKSKSKDKSSTQNQPGGDDEDNIQLPPTLTRNAERNLSISRSGRHKVKKTQRLSVMSDEMYSPEAKSSPPQWPQSRPLQENSAKTATTTTTSSTVQSSVTHAHTNVQSTKMPSSGTGSYHCRETVDPTTKQLSGSQRMPRAPTAV